MHTQFPVFGYALEMSKAIVAANAEAERIFSRFKYRISLQLTTGTQAMTRSEVVDDIMTISEHGRGGTPKFEKASYDMRKLM